MANHPTRAAYQHLHSDEKRRRKGALERLESQLEKLNKNDTKALFSKSEGYTPLKEDFINKIEYVNNQITSTKKNGI